MNRSGEWRLSPAYDMTYIIDVNGFRPNLDHCISARAKMFGLTYDDAIAFARDNGVRKPESIIRSVAAALSCFRELSIKNHVREEWIGRIEQTIHDHLVQWGLAEDWQIREIEDLDGHHITNIHIELAAKGNIHLSAAIDGNERRYIFRSGTPVHETLSKQGLRNLKLEDITGLVRDYLIVT